MKIKTLTENNSLKNTIETLCQPYLTLNPLDKHKPLYRGIAKINATTTLNVRKNRRPKTTNGPTHIAIDNYFEKTFGIRFRSNSIFCTSDKFEAESYGNDDDRDNTTFVVFPIGDFTFCWSPNVGDLFLTVERELNIKQQFLKKLYPDTYNEYIFDHFRYLNLVMQHQDMFNQLVFENMETLHYQITNFKSAIHSGNEVMIHCDKYIAVSLNDYHSLK